MIRVLILTDGLNIGGMEKFTLCLVQHSDRNRYHFTIGYPKDGALRVQYEALGIPLFNYSKAKDIYERINIYKKFWNERIPVVFPLRIIAPVRKVVAFVLQNNINIIQTNGIFSYIIGSIASRITHIPSIRIQGNIMKETEKTHYRFFPYLPFSRWTAKYVLFIKEQKIDFQDLRVPENRLYYIGSYGIDIHEFHPDLSGSKVREEFGISADALVIGQAGRIDSKKRFDFMVNAARSVLDKYPETIFLVVGDGPERKKIGDMVKDCGIEKNVIFTGFRLDIPQIVASFDIALFTMADMTGGTSNWEAMASGKPIVCTSNAIIEDGKTGFNVPSDDIQAFADAIITLIRNPDLRHRMGDNARQVSEERYDFVKSVIPKMQKLYDIIARA